MDPYHDNAGKFTSKGGGGAVAGAAKALAGKTGGRFSSPLPSKWQTGGVAQKPEDLMHADSASERANLLGANADQAGTSAAHTNAMKAHNAATTANANVNNQQAVMHHRAKAEHHMNAANAALTVPKTPAAAAAKVLGGKDHVAAHNDAVDVRNAQNVQKNAKASRAIVNAELTKHNTDRGYTRSLLRRARDARDLKAAGVVNNSTAAHKKVNALLAFRRRQTSSSVK